MARDGTPSPTYRWYAGETGCAQLIVGLKERVTQLRHRETLEVTCHNPGASVDIFVWCRMTGHRLLSDASPVYVIQRNAHYQQQGLHKGENDA